MTPDPQSSTSRTTVLSPQPSHPPLICEASIRWRRRGESAASHTDIPCGPHVPGIFRTPWILGLKPSQGVGESSGGSPWAWGQGNNSCSGKSALSAHCPSLHPLCPLFTPLQKSPGSAAAPLPHWGPAKEPWGLVPRGPLGLGSAQAGTSGCLGPGATGHWVLASLTVSQHPPPPERKLPLCSPRWGQARLARH